jgi:WD40 repeat protein
MMKSAPIFRRKNHANTQWESEATFRHTDAVNCITLSNDGQLVPSGSGDHTVKIWDTPTGQRLTTFRGHRRCHPIRNLAHPGDWLRYTNLESKQVSTGENVGCRDRRLPCFDGSQI